VFCKHVRFILSKLRFGSFSSV